jgi:acyl transferase domain-containing protein/acyl carrier protein
MLNPKVLDRELLAAVENALVRMAASVVNADAHAPEAARERGWEGWDSLAFARFANRICDHYDIELDATVFLECSGIADLARQLLVTHTDAIRAAHPTPDHPATGALPVHSRIPSSRDARRERPHAPGEPVAIVGTSVRFPQCRDLRQFWEVLRTGHECISEIPADRWDWRALAGDPRREIGRTDVRWGGFIDDVAEFDPLFFGISPKEAEVMDPQQRLLLMCGVAAIEDAGYAPGSLAGTRTGVFVGLVSNNGYEQRVVHANVPVEGYSASASAPSMGPNRLSYWLDLHGPSEPVETTCSSSLVAVLRAMRAIQSGECDMALAGGVNLILSPAKHVSFSKAGMLSGDGHCRPFSAGANGYVRGEGVAMLLLKPLSAAERDGDEICALLRGGAVNHGGRASSLTAPNTMAQASLLAEAYATAGIDPRTVGYIEAHGTGTPLGDPIEIESLKTAFARLQAASIGEIGVETWRCGIGSVKGTIGHLEAAAGVAGLLKVVAQLRHCTLVKSLNAEPVSHRIQLDESPFFIVTETQGWPATIDETGRPVPRRAGVSSFGIGGVNAHVIVEEYVDARPDERDDERPPGGECIVLSARDEIRLRDQTRQLLAALHEREFTDEDLPRIAYTLQVGRDAMMHRLGFTARSLAGLRRTLGAIVESSQEVAGVYHGVAERSDASLSFDPGDCDGAVLDRSTDDGVLAQWTRGADVDWRGMYPRRPRRIRLPTYPFARERCWIDTPARAFAGAGVPVSPSGAVERLHPLLHRNTSTLSGQRFSSVLTGEEPFLRDHLVGGRRVFPAVAYLEMARAAALASVDREVSAAAVVVRDIVWERPLYVEARCAVHIKLSGRAEDSLDFEIYTEAPDAGTTVHARGRVAVEPASPRDDESVDLTRLRRRCEEAASSTFYADLEARGVAYGPFYRGVCLVAVGTSEDGGPFALADISIPPEVDTAGYLLHPTVADGALQALMVLRRWAIAPAGRSSLALPFAMHALEIRSPVPSVATVHVQARSDRARRRDLKEEGPAVWDLTICEPDGRVCVRMEGLTLRAIGSRQDAPPVLLRPIWIERPVGERPAPGSSTATRHVWLAGDLADAADMLRTLAPRVTWEALPRSAGSVAGWVMNAAEHVFSHLREQMRAKPPAHVIVQLVVPAGDEEAESLTALAALFRTAHGESPYVRGQIVVLTERMPLARLIAVLTTNARAASPADALIRVGTASRQVVTWSAVTEGKTVPAPPWRNDGVYLLTGGSGRLAGLLASDIRRHAPRAHVVLASRTARLAASPVGAEAARADGSIAYQDMDVSDAGSVQAAVDTILATHGELTGVVHCAGVIDDSFIVRKEREEFRAVLMPKVEGVVALDEATRSLPLELFILYSSIGSVVGNAGQSDYTTANAFLDWFAVHRNRLVDAGLRRGRTLAVNWSLWAEGGMRVAAGIAAGGAASAPTLSTNAGLTALLQAWQTGADQVAVVHEAYPRLTELRDDVQRESGPVAAEVANVARGTGATRPAADAADAGLRAFASRLLVRRLGLLLKVATDRFDAHVSLQAYGLDSLTGLNVASALEREFGRLPKTLLFDCSTIDELAQYFVTAHGDTLRALLPFEEVDAATIL